MMSVADTGDLPSDAEISSSSSAATPKGNPVSEEIVWLYRVLLGREPESDAVIHEAKELPSFDALRQRIMASKEFKAIVAGRRPAPTGRYSFSLKDDLRTTLTWFSEAGASDVQWAYRTLLERDCEDLEVANEHLARNQTLFRLVNEVLHSDERRALEERRVFSERFLARSTRQRRPRIGEMDVTRILLFGAFGNGNLGDECQPDAVYEAVGDNLQIDGRIELTACSWEKIRTPALKHAGVAPYDEVIDSDALAKYDLLLIGGGGLIGVPHFPLFSMDWVTGLRSIGIPYGLLSIGTTSEELTEPTRAEAYKTLLDGAAFVTARDAGSLEGLRAVGVDAAYLPDACSYSARPRERQAVQPDKRRVAFVPKIPIDEQERRVLRSFIDLQRRYDAMGAATEALLFEPELDRSIAQDFNNPVFVQSREEYLDHISRCSVVLSMRYHGVLLALVNGVSCWGFGSRKVQQLFELAGIDCFVSLVKPDMEFPPFDAEAWCRVDEFLDRARTSWKSFCANELSRLVKV